MEVRMGGKRHDLKQADSTRGGQTRGNRASRALGRECDELCRTAAVIRAAVGGFDSIIEGQSHPRLVCFGRRSSDVSILPRARLATADHSAGVDHGTNSLVQQSCVGLLFLPPSRALLFLVQRCILPHPHSSPHAPSRLEALPVRGAYETCQLGPDVVEQLYRGIVRAAMR